MQPYKPSALLRIAAAVFLACILARFVIGDSIAMLWAQVIVGVGVAVICIADLIRHRRQQRP